MAIPGTKFPKTMASGHFSLLDITSLAGGYPTSGGTLLQITDASAATGTIPISTLFQAADNFVEFLNVKEMPSFGNPSNVVNVRIFGQPVSAQVQAQADSPQMTFSIAYTPEPWAAKGDLGQLLPVAGAALAGTTQILRMTWVTSQVTAKADKVNKTTGLGKVPNAAYYKYVKVEALEVQNSLDDAVMATVTMSAPNGLTYGPFAVDGA